MDQTTRPTPSSGPGTTEQRVMSPATVEGKPAGVAQVPGGATDAPKPATPTPDAASALGGWPGSSQGPLQRGGGEPNPQAQHETGLVQQNAQLPVISGPRGQSYPGVYDPEQKINSGQCRAGLDRRHARHSSFRPYER